MWSKASPWQRGQLSELSARIECCKLLGPTKPRTRGPHSKSGPELPHGTSLDGELVPGFFGRFGVLHRIENRSHNGQREGPANKLAEEGAGCAGGTALCLLVAFSGFIGFIG